MSNYFVHESSYVEEGSFIVTGTKAWHFSHVISGAAIGSDCILEDNVFVVHLLFLPMSLILALLLRERMNTNRLL